MATGTVEEVAAGTVAGNVIAGKETLEKGAGVEGQSDLPRGGKRLEKREGARWRKGKGTENLGMDCMHCGFYVLVDNPTQKSIFGDFVFRRWLLFFYTPQSFTFD